MATLTKIILVLLQLSLAGAFFRKVDGAFERESVPVAMMVTGAILARSRRLQVQELSEKLRLIEADL